MSSLKSKTVKGLSWNLVGTVAGSGISFIVGIILARILTPEDFGLVGMISILLAISTSIAESGISIALIRQPQVTEADYSTAFIFNFGVGLILYSLLFFSAPFIASFFREQRLIDLLRVIGLIVIINGFSFVHQTILTREVSFKLLSLSLIAASLISGIIAIYLAASGFGYWSIVWQFVLRQFLNTVFLSLSTRWLPLAGFSKSSFKSLFSFGSRILVSGLISTIQQNIYYLIIGRIFSPATVGFYNRAESFNSLATSNITSTFSKVFFPILASLQNDKSRLRSGLVKVNCMTFLICGSVMIFLAATAKPMIIILIGEKWSESIWMLQLMCLATLVMPLNALNRDMLFIAGRSDLFLRLQMIKIFIFIPGVILAICFGVKILLIYSLVSSLLSFFINSRYAKNHFDYSSQQQLRDIAPYLAVVLFSGAVMWGISFVQLPNWLQMCTQLGIGGGVMILLCELTKLTYYVELKYIAIDFIRSRYTIAKG